MTADGHNFGGMLRRMHLGVGFTVVGHLVSVGGVEGIVHLPLHQFPGALLVFVLHPQIPSLKQSAIVRQGGCSFHVWRRVADEGGPDGRHLYSYLVGVSTAE
jgi:hypothetical protein